MNRIGMNTAASDVVIVRIVKPISRDPFSDAVEPILAVLDVAHDVLEHHDRVVDDEADAEDERHHRQVVEAEAQQLHDGERAENRERQRQRRNQRRRSVVEEQEDHRDDQQQRDEHRPLDVFEGRADGLRPVAAHGHVNRRRQLRDRGPAAARGRRR